MAEMKKMTPKELDRYMAEASKKSREEISEVGRMLGTRTLPTGTLGRELRALEKEKGGRKRRTRRTTRRRKTHSRRK